jgi:AraC-like DNA-binding protein
MEKVIHEIHRMKNPQLPFIFRTSQVTETGILANWHENIELLCILDGEGTVSLDGRPYRVRAGDVAVVNSDCLHAAVGEPQLTYSYLIIDSSFCLENGIDISRLEFCEQVRDAELSALLLEVGDRFTRLSEHEGEPFALPHLRYCVLGVLLRLLTHHLSATGKREDAEEERGRARIKEVVQYLRDCRETPSLDALARKMGMSKFYLCREFKRITGTTVVAYQNRLRCERARRLILEGAKVSEAAFAVGFDNLSYFSKIYKRYMGASPSAKQAKA